MRILGIDFGERRIGLAISDETATIATPLPLLERRLGKRPPVQTIVDLAAAAKVEAIVMGLPLDLSGEETEWSMHVRDVAEKIGKRLAVPVYYIDERMTSVRAERTLRSLGLPKGKREEKGRIDQGAAMLILQAWLDREARRRRQDDE